MVTKISSWGLGKWLEVKASPGATLKITPEMRCLRRAAPTRLDEKLKYPQGLGSYGKILEWLKQEWNVTHILHPVVSQSVITGMSIWQRYC